MNLLYRILQNFLIYFLPIVILLFSVSNNLPNANLHKQTFQNTNFYNRFSTEFGKLNQNKNPTKNSNSVSFWSFLDTTNLEKPAEIQIITEKNLDLAGNWLLGNSENWEFYWPKNISDNSPKTAAKNLVEVKKDTIPDCDATSLEKIKAEISSKTDFSSIDLSKNFCLPKEVKSGQASLEDFLTQNNLEKLVNSTVNSAADNLKVSAANAAWQNTYGFFSFIRQYLTRIRTTSPLVIAGMSVVLLIITLLAGTIGRKPLQDFRGNLWKIAISTLSLSVVLILIFGGIAFVNSWFGEFIFGQKSPEISNILTIQWLWFLFDLVSLAVFSSFGLIAFGLILMLLPKGSTESRNKKLQKNDNYTQNANFDNPKNQQKSQRNSENNENLNSENLAKNGKPKDFYYDSKNSNENSSFNSNLSNFNTENDNFSKNKSSNQSNSQNNSHSNFDSNSINNSDNFANNENPYQNNSSNNFRNNSTFDQEFQQEAEQIYKPKPIRPSISGVILPHEEYEIPTQIPRNRPIPPRIHLKIHKTENENPYSEPNLEINSNSKAAENSESNPYSESQNQFNNSNNLNLVKSEAKSDTLSRFKNPENPTNFVILESREDSKNKNSN